MEISGRPAVRTDSWHAETNARPDLCRANKVHSTPGTRAVRNASGRVHLSNLSARKSTPVRPRGARTAHRRESHPGLLRLSQVRSRGASLGQIRRHRYRSIFPSPTKSISFVRSMGDRKKLIWWDSEKWTGID